MPTRRIWRYKTRVAPLTETEWSFFLAKNAADFDRLHAGSESGEEFFTLYYADGWKETYAEHRDEIEAEWSRRGWTEAQKKFVMTPYFERFIVLSRDLERAIRREQREEKQKKENENARKKVDRAGRGTGRGDEADRCEPREVH